MRIWFAVSILISTMLMEVIGEAFRKWAPSAVSLEMVLRDEREMSDGFLLGPIHALARSKGECELLFRVFREL